MQLPLQMQIVRRLCQALLQGGGDLAPELPGGGAGIGDDQKIIDIASVPRLGDLAQ